MRRSAEPIQEGFDDAPAIFVDLVLEGRQHFGQAHGRQALGAHHGRAGRQGVGRREAAQAFVARWGPPQFVAVEELFPFFLPGRLQFDGRGELLQESPGGTDRPVVESFQRRGVILAQGGLEWVDEQGALFEEVDLIAAEAAQEGGGFVLRTRSTRQA